MKFALSIAVVTTAFAVLLIAAGPAVAQTTVATGSVQGTILDPSDAAMPNAKITITNKDTAQTFNSDPKGANDEVFHL